MQERKESFPQISQICADVGLFKNIKKLCKKQIPQSFVKTWWLSNVVPEGALATTK